MDKTSCYDCRQEFEKGPSNPYVVDDTLGFEIWYLCPGCVQKRRADGRPVETKPPPPAPPAKQPVAAAPAPPAAPKKKRWFGLGT